MAALHPALRPYTAGYLGVIKWMNKAGELRSTHVKTVKCVALPDGDQAVFIQKVGEIGEDGKPAKGMIRASQIQRYLDAEAAAAQQVATRAGAQATEKQVAYAASLVDQLGEIGWHNSGPGQMLAKPTMEDLRAMSKTYISALIAQLREELGYDY